MLIYAQTYFRGLKWFQIAESKCTAHPESSNLQNKTKRGKVQRGNRLTMTERRVDKSAK